MNLTLNNIAKVYQANIDIDGITVIAGYNGTGKSTISKSLYAMLSAQNGLLSRVSSERQRAIYNVIYRWSVQFINSNNVTLKHLDFGNNIHKQIQNMDDRSEFTLDTLNKIVEGQKPNDINIDYGSVKNLYEDLKTEMNAESNRYISLILRKEFYNIFRGQVNTLGKTTEGEVFLNIDDNKSYVVFTDNEIKDMQTGFNEFNPIYISSHNLLDDISDRRLPRRINRNLYDTRLLDMLTKNEDNIIAPDFYNQKQRSGIFDDILQSIVKGHIEINGKNIGYVENDKVPPVEFSNLASGIKPFIILKTLIKNGSLKENGMLIYDEPEVNLHPEWQIKLAELIVLLYKELKVRVLINSHSPYFVRAIEFFCDKYRIVNDSNYYFMRQNYSMGMCSSENVKNNLSNIYNTMQRPFEEIVF